MFLRLLVTGVLALPAAALIGPAAGAKPASAPAAHVTVKDGYVAAAPPGAKVMAAFMTVTNDGPSAVTITGVSSPDFTKAELHETRQTGTMTRMAALPRLTVPAGASVTFQPGGKHVMLFAPKRNLQAGDTVTLTVTFAKGRQTVVLPVRAGMGAHHGHHDHP